MVMQLDSEKSLPVEEKRESLVILSMMMIELGIGFDRPEDGTKTIGQLRKEAAGKNGYLLKKSGSDLPFYECEICKTDPFSTPKPVRLMMHILSCHLNASLHCHCGEHVDQMADVIPHFKSHGTSDQTTESENTMAHYKKIADMMKWKKTSWMPQEHFSFEHRIVGEYFEVD